MCGVDFIGHEFSGGFEGLSPHARGRRLRTARARGFIRFIPACAGETLTEMLEFQGFSKKYVRLVSTPLFVYYIISEIFDKVKISCL